MLIAVLCCGCRVGASVNKLEPMQSGGGIAVDLELVESKHWPGGEVSSTPFQSVSGELLFADDEGLMINGRAVAFFGYGQIKKAQFDGKKKFNFEGLDIAPTFLSELQLFSRYPTGHDEMVMSNLLRALGQDSLFVFR